MVICTTQKATKSPIPAHTPFQDSIFEDLAIAEANANQVYYLRLGIDEFETFPKSILGFKNLRRLILTGDVLVFLNFTKG